MQKIRVSKVQPIGRGGTAVYDENGIRFSGFQPELRYIRVGDVIGVDVEVKGKYNNISAMKILDYGSGVAGISGDRESIEAQTAFKGIVELACHLPVEGKLGIAYEKALDWALARPGFGIGPRPVPAVIRPAEKNTGNGINTEWLKRALRTLQDSGTGGWSNAAVVASLNRLTGNNARSVSEAIKPLNRKQAERFVKEVQAALDVG